MSADKMTTLASLRRERQEWKARALAAEDAAKKAQARNSALIALFDQGVTAMAQLLNLARNR
jgi:hypothetical protein